MPYHKMQMNKIKTTLQVVAPALASGLEGPLAGVARKCILDALSLNGNYNDENLDDILAEQFAISNNLKNIQLADQQFRQEMKALGISATQLNAYKNNKHSEAFHQHPQLIISILFIVFYFMLLAALLTVEISDDLNMVKGENSLLNEIEILLGVLTAGVGQVLSYWFRSSQ